MKVVRNLVVVALALSVILNIIMFRKYRMEKPLFAVNGKGMTKKDYDNALEIQGGYPLKRQVVERMVTDQEAEKQGVAPTQKEVDETLDEVRELNPNIAQQITSQPYMMDEVKNNIRTQIERSRLTAKAFPITDDEIKTEYEANPGKYDAPDKARLEFALVIDASVTKEVTDLMKKVPPVEPATIEQNYLRQVHFLGDKGIYTVVRPFNHTEQDPSNVFAMKDGDVQVIAPGGYAQMGAKAVIIRKVGNNVPGHKNSPDDPKTKEKIREALAQTHAKPWEDMLHDIWKTTDFTSENPEDKQVLESLMFPNQGKTASGK